jgi:6-pyruvoyltetrahydropterin/6-carboxytetrahydropterin synthase
VSHPVISLTRTVSFPATHRMWRQDWTEAQNRAHFGPVAEYHGHQYSCTVTVAGPLDPVTGMVVDLALLDAILAEEVTGRLGGKRLNTELPEFSSGRPLPTCEALASILYARIAVRLPSGLRLERVRVAEDPTLYADRTGDP